MLALVTERMYFTSYSYLVCQSWLHLYLAMMWSWHIMAVVLKWGYWAYFPFTWQDPCPGAYGQKALVLSCFMPFLPAHRFVYTPSVKIFVWLYVVRCNCLKCSNAEGHHWLRNVTLREYKMAIQKIRPTKTIAGILLLFFCYLVQRYIHLHFYVIVSFWGVLPAELHNGPQLYAHTFFMFQWLWQAITPVPSQ